MSAKVYVVVERERTMDGVKVIAAFKQEGDAEKSASAHKQLDNSVWVEEINYYE